ncbi:T9SS type A sorting domain-containing protein [candidate division KSB1 bacterium]|nr:T9SS type A sorting domain-containing protein [candidate division KSB1 bacterium]NIR69507.1 T9SS type A sorting domain-containing protein [candidate division KSB1 bacterium]NIS24275.1 T9SS type A sorting domain-containing protein [candidate division KSB1 bacterium]NIT71190.1 T9SS type A sorting domain-containing protein [candidate division KSB1 bacterium]NIU24894.1 T9SS type A sorting domain-containing protein [candidate division KSB1 bacterium]
MNTDVNGEITIAGFGTQPLSGSGALLGLVFNVVGNPGESTELCIQSVTFNSGEPVADIPRPCLTYGVFNNFNIAGKVSYGITGAPMSDISVSLSGGASDRQTTDTGGDYLFGELEGGLNYTVSPSKTGDFDVNSITCFDAALIAQFVVGLNSLTAEQQKAADVNEDGFIFTFDAALICRFAVGLPPFNENEQTGRWRFEPRNRSYTALNSDHTSQDFVAMLLGEVDGSWKPETVAKETAAFERYGYWKDLVASPGELVNLPLTVEKDADILSVDIDFQYDPKILRFVEVAKTDLSEAFHVVTNAELGRLRVGAYGTEALKAEGTLLLLQFEVIGKNGQRSYLNLGRFQVNGGLVKDAEAELVVGTATAQIPKQFALGQNYPNPFNPETTIRFDIPNLNGKNVNTRLFIYKVTGQLVRVLVNEEKPAGSYEIKWDGRDKAGQSVSSGVYFYKLTAGDFTATRKMTLLR